jgi:hypothetical protein
MNKEENMTDYIKEPSKPVDCSMCSIGECTKTTPLHVYNEWKQYHDQILSNILSKNTQDLTKPCKQTANYHSGIDTFKTGANYKHEQWTKYHDQEITRLNKRIIKLLNQIATTKPSDTPVILHKTIQPPTLVKYKYTSEHAQYNYHPFNNKETYIYMGDLLQAKGHCVIIDMNGKVYTFYHTDLFRLATEDEV